jgi:hypothetical protein
MNVDLLRVVVMNLSAVKVNVAAPVCESFGLLRTPDSSSTLNYY